MSRGEEDQTLAPAAAQDLAALIPDARLTAIPEAGHLTPLEQPERVADLLDAFAATASGGVPNGEAPGSAN